MKNPNLKNYLDFQATRGKLSILGNSPIYLTKLMDILMRLSDYHTVIDSLDTVILMV